MAFQTKGSFKGPGTSKTMPAIGQTSSVGKAPPTLKSPIQGPRAVKPNTRDYGKPAPAPAAPPVSPFGPSSVGGIDAS
jgi:hypothetical protein